MNEGENDEVERKKRGGHRESWKCPVIGEQILTVIARTFGFPFEHNLCICLLRPCWNSLKEMRVRHKNDEFITAPSPIILFTIGAALRHGRHFHCLHITLWGKQNTRLNPKIHTTTLSSTWTWKLTRSNKPLWENQHDEKGLIFHKPQSH